MNTLSPLIANRAVAFIVLLAILMWSFGFPTWVPFLDAASLTFVSDTLSDSDIGGTNSNHTISFSNPTAIVDDDTTIVITFPGEFNLSTGTAVLGIEDFDVATGTTPTENNIDYECGAGVHMAVATGTPSSQSITFTVCSGEGGGIPAGGTTTIEIGTNAASGGPGDNQIVNPTDAGSYEITIAGTQFDSGATRVAIIDDVVVTASVDTTFTFTVNGLPGGVTVNGSPTTTADQSTAITLPFGSLTVGESSVMAQNLTVATNATNGFTVTVQANQNLTSSTGADIDTFIDGAETSSSTEWTAPGGTLGNENEYGHMGLTSEDETLGDSTVTTWFYDDLWAGDFVSSPREIFYHDGPADGVTNDQGSTTVGYQIDIMAFQEAGSDYTANLTYVATPVF